MPMVPRAMLTVLFGPPKMGKSLLTCRWAADLSKRGESTVLVSAEDSPGHTTKPRLEALQADMSRIYYSEPLSLWNGEFPWFVDQVLKAKATLLVLDPFTAMMAETQSSWSDQHVRRALVPLKELAEALNCAVVYVMHLNKAQGTDPLQRLGGSVAFGAAARSAILVGTAPDDEQGKLRLVAHAATNISEVQPTQQWEIRPTVIPGPSKPINTARLDYRGVAGFTAPEMLLPKVSPEDMNTLERAEQFLRDSLPPEVHVSVSDLTAMAKAMGVSERSLERARANLGVQPVKKGRSWFVYLPVTK